MLGAFEGAQQTHLGVHRGRSVTLNSNLYRGRELHPGSDGRRGGGRNGDMPRKAEVGDERSNAGANHDEPLRQVFGGSVARQTLPVEA